MAQTKCSRCGGAGHVSRGMVVNGTCYKCGGDGKHRPGVYASARFVKVVQYALVDVDGRHLAINTDPAILRGLSIAGAVDVVAL